MEFEFHLHLHKPVYQHGTHVPIDFPAIQVFGSDRFVFLCGRNRVNLPIGLAGAFAVPSLCYSLRLIEEFGTGIACGAHDAGHEVHLLEMG